QQHFRTYLRKKQFLNPIKVNNAFTNLDNDVNLSEEMKSFTIPVTKQEAEILKNKNSMTKEELISVINSILISFPELQRLNNAEEAVDEENIDKELVNEEIT
ncbi:11879_t:CDS:2, partial [Racocetra fulgida]